MSYGSLSISNREPSMLKAEHTYSISAIDTETYKGYAKLICDDAGRSLLNPDANSMLEFLTNRRLEQSHVFAYNLRFDAQAMLKLLPNKYIKEISSEGRTEYNGFKLKYIPGKLLTVQDEHRHTIRMYDLAQFFETSLDVAAKTFIQAQKQDFEFRAMLNTNKEIWKHHEAEIVSYCCQDARVTADLGTFLNTKFIESFNVKPQNYISKGNLGKYLVRHSCYLPDIRKIPEGALSAAFYAYKGGRFEVFTKGTVEYAELYDIVSAYPFEIQNLIDVTKGEWKIAKDVSPEAYYGFYVCKVRIPYQRICPIAYVAPQNYLYYPFGEWNTYLTKEEVEAYRPYADIEVIYGWEFYPSKIVKPFQEHIQKLFRRKQAIPKTDYAYDLVKKMMNSVYGAFYEKTKIDGKIKTGKLFNPIYATVITANTRIKLFLMSKQHEQDVISMATDSLLIKGKHAIKTSKELGEWDFDGSGKSVVLTNGVYQIEGKTKTRGIMAKTEAGGKRKMRTDYGEYENIFDFMMKQPELQEYTFITEKPVQMKEAIKSREKFTIEDINVWREYRKTIKIDTDLKRIFTKTFGNGGNYFRMSVDSVPMVVRE